MEWTIIAGYAGALIMGITLGLLGAGGSILTVPSCITYLVDAVLSTAYSLFIVGFTALAGAVPNMRKGHTLPDRIPFSIPSLIAVYLTRAFLVPAIPDTVMTLGDWVLTKEMAILGFCCHHGFRRHQYAAPAVTWKIRHLIPWEEKSGTYFAGRIGSRHPDRTGWRRRRFPHHTGTGHFGRCP